MSHTDLRSAERPAPDRVLVDIASYAHGARIDSAVAYETARYCLLDSIACSMRRRRVSSRSVRKYST